MDRGRGSGEETMDVGAWVERLIRDFCLDSPENSLRNGTGEPAWGVPMVGFSNGADPLYAFLKEDIGPAFFMTPGEIFRKSFPRVEPVPDEEITVIAWILPQTAATRSDHRRCAGLPSERWARSRHFGEMFNETLRAHIAERLQSSGFDAVAPVLAPFWARHVSERHGFASTWSERHAAHVSGLGTFGLCDGLITPLGKAVRCGSVIARMTIPATPRPYAGHRDYCLHFSRGVCGKCVSRCPAGALSREGHDKERCSRFLRGEIVRYTKEQFGFETHGCGLCQTGVPCESRIPDPEMRREVETGRHPASTGDHAPN